MNIALETRYKIFSFGRGKVRERVTDVRKKRVRSGLAANRHTNTTDLHTNLE